MAFGRVTKILLILFVACAILDVPLAEGGVFKKCWDTWSRCTKWSSAATGILWQGCNDRCKCLGRSYGSCVLSRSECPSSRYAWQCRCYGSYGKRKSWWCGA